MIRVLVVDDHAVVRRGLADILLEAGDLDVVAQVDSAAAARTILDTVAIDVVVLDLGLPDSTGTAFVEELRRRAPAPGVLVVTIEPESQYAVRAIRSGAGGYLTKRSAPEELVAAVRAIAAGDRYIAPRVADELAAAVSTQADARPHDALSAREYEVMRLLARGMTVGEIAEALVLSRQTITTYRARVLGKLGVRRNSQLTQYALDHNLLE
ncbi:MAG: response regulator [Spirochaetota bacterium]